MSQYLNIYIRCNDTFMPLMSFSRSTTMYQAFNDTYVPYGKIKQITEAQVANVKESLTVSTNNMRNIRKKREEEKSLIATFNNSAEEKLSLIEDLNISIDEIDEELEELAAAMAMLRVFDDILESARYNSDDELTCQSFKDKQVLYCGIESAAWPTVEDIDD